MNRQAFNQLVSNPREMEEKGLGVLKEVLKHYPYCQTAHLLQAFYLHQRQDPGFQEVMKRSAAYLGDRRRITTLQDEWSGIVVDEQIQPEELQEVPVPEFQEISSPVEIHEEKEEISLENVVDLLASGDPIEIMDIEEVKVTEEKTIPVYINTASVPEHPASLRGVDTRLSASYTRDDLLAIVKKRLSEIQSGMKYQPVPVQEFRHQPPSISKDELIDRFIREEPQISRPRVSVNSTPEGVQKSNADQGEIVSETLARIYADQGNIQKAIQVYQKLSLVNTEKSRYFAAQIQKLRDQLP